MDRRLALGVVERGQKGIRGPGRVGGRHGRGNVGPGNDPQCQTQCHRDAGGNLSEERDVGIHGVNLPKTSGGHRPNVVSAPAGFPPALPSVWLSGHG